MPLLPFMRRKEPPPIPPIEEWRPQAFGHSHFRNVADPVIEPAWGGVRVLARVTRREPNGDAGSVAVTLIDEDGLDATPEFEAIATVLGEAALSDRLIVDGHLTVEATQETVGREGAMELVSPPPGQIYSHMITGGRTRVPDADRNIDPNRPIAFVAVDLLMIDGTTLLDLPLIERKRLLDGALKLGELVRVTPFTRPPVGSFADSWYGLGFRALVYKGANGRYHPSGTADDWAVVPIRSR